MSNQSQRRERTERALVAAGCVAADEEADELLGFVGEDDALLDALLVRRSEGEPLAWLTGSTRFCGLEITIATGVYVPRWQSEPLAELAAARLPPEGTAIDLGTGSGAIVALLRHRHAASRVIGTETDPVAIACAISNGVEVAAGPLFDAVPVELRGRVDVVVGVLPYVPSSALAFLPRDVLAYEPLDALDGGPDGLTIVRRAIEASASWLRVGGSVLLEVGDEQPAALEASFTAAGFAALGVIYDAEGDVRGVEAVAVSRHLSR